MRIKNIIVTLHSKYNAELNIADLFRTYHCCDGKHALVTKLLHGCKKISKASPDNMLSPCIYELRCSKKFNYVISKEDKKIQL